MSDLAKLISESVGLLRSGEPLTVSSVARVLGLDLARASIIGKSNRFPAAVDANFVGADDLVDIAIAYAPTRMLWVLFKTRVASATELSRMALFGVTPRLQRSKSGKGYSIVCDFPDIRAGVTASSGTNRVEAVFWEELEGPRQASSKAAT